MNQRREARFAVDQPVEVVVFGSPDLHLQGRIQNASGQGIGLLLTQRLATGKTLKINLVDGILLGEVIYCQAQGENWYLGVELEHALFGLTELAEALRGFDDGPSGREHPNALQHTRSQGQQ
jgi:hypothetical protein